MVRWLTYIRNFFIATFLVFASVLLVLQIPSLNTKVVELIINLVTPRDMIVRIRGINGVFPFDITVDKIKIKDQKSKWLQLNDVALDWQGVDILYGNIHFLNLSAKKVTYWRSPAMKGSEEPLTLPRLNVDKIHVEAIEMPNLYSGSFQLNGKIVSPENDTHHAQLDLRFSDNPEQVDTLIYDQKGIHYTLKNKIDRPLNNFSKLSPEVFARIQKGRALVDIDIKGDTYFKAVTGHMKGELIDFYTTDTKLQKTLGVNPKVVLDLQADDEGKVHKASGNLNLGQNRELSLTALPMAAVPLTYKFQINLKTSKQQGQLEGQVFISDHKFVFDTLHLSGLGSDIHGKAIYGDTLSAHLKGEIHDLSALGDLINFPIGGQVELDASYEGQDLALNLNGKSIRVGSNNTPFETVSATTQIVKGEGPFTLRVQQGTTTADLAVYVKNAGQQFDVRQLRLTEGTSPLIYLDKPFSIFYKDQIVSILTATIKCLDGHFAINKLELSDNPTGEIVLDKITARVLNPLIEKVEWQGNMSGKLRFFDDKSKGYYTGFLKFNDFGIDNKLRRTQKLSNLNVLFSHSGKVLTIDSHYSDATTSNLKGKIQVTSNHYFPHESDLMKSSLAGTLDLSALNTLIWWGDRFKGKLTIDHLGEGTLLTPSSRSKVTLENGYYENGAIGTILKDIRGVATYSNQKLMVSEFSGRDYDKGAFRMTGNVQFTDFSSPYLNLHLNFNKLILMNTDEAIITVTGKLDGITLPSNNHQVKGEVLVNSALINLSQVSSEPKTIRTFRTEQELQKKQQKVHQPSSTNVDIKVDIPKKLLVQGYGVRSEWKGGLRARGPINAPNIDGSINSISGRLDISSKRLMLAPSSVTFKTHNGDIIPVLDIKATKQVREYEAFIILSGSSNNPSIEFISLPALPTEDVIALILFDKLMAEVSAAQSLQLATTMAAVKAGNFKGSAFDSLNQLLGVDDISLQKAEVSEAVDDDKQSYSLSIGKQLSKRVYVAVEQGLQQEVGTKLKAKVDVTKKTKLDIETGTQNTAVGYGLEFRY
ncbi:MAG: translocation/assembly module TamB [Candidatus Paracaedibacteraceae bacterium]|nr:translocation/assembly module TamB [Candidatus Paracaedibacteraceae bacterium]